MTARPDARSPWNSGKYRQTGSAPVPAPSRSAAWPEPAKAGTRAGQRCPGAIFPMPLIVSKAGAYSPWNRPSVTMGKLGYARVGTRDPFELVGGLAEPAGLQIHTALEQLIPERAETPEILPLGVHGGEAADGSQRVPLQQTDLAESLLGIAVVRIQIPRRRPEIFLRPETDRGRSPDRPAGRRGPNAGRGSAPGMPRPARSARGPFPGCASSPFPGNWN